MSYNPAYIIFTRECIVTFHIFQPFYKFDRESPLRFGLLYSLLFVVLVNDVWIFVPVRRACLDVLAHLWCWVYESTVNVTSLAPRALATKRMMLFTNSFFFSCDGASFFTKTSFCVP